MCEYINQSDTNKTPLKRKMKSVPIQRLYGKKKKVNELGLNMVKYTD